MRPAGTAISRVTGSNYLTRLAACLLGSRLAFSKALSICSLAGSVSREARFSPRWQSVGLIDALPSDRLDGVRINPPGEAFMKMITRITRVASLAFWLTMVSHAQAGPQGETAPPAGSR